MAVANTLGVARDDLRKEAGYYLGYTRTEANWSAEQLDDITETVKDALRLAYWPPRVDGVASHNWRFLKPVSTLETVASTVEYDAPDDFASLDGECLYYPESDGFQAIRLTSWNAIADLRQQGSVTGRPDRFAIVPVRQNGTFPLRFQFHLYPTPDAAYVLSYRYCVKPGALEETAPYTLGGEEHSRLFLAAIRAAAEMNINDGDDTGPKYRQFLTQLQISIDIDNRLMPDFLGRMCDPSAELPVSRRQFNVTYNDVQY